MRRFNIRRPLAVLGLLIFALLASAGIAAAASTVVVTQYSLTWANMDTRPGGASLITSTYGAPGGLGMGALELTTNATTTAKADYWTFTHAGTPLANVTDLAYWTYQAPAVPLAKRGIAAVSYQFQINVNGSVTPGAPGFATLVFEPYQSGIAGNPPIVNSVWQSWDVDSGKFWSTAEHSVGTCILKRGFGGPPFYTLATLRTICPDAVILGVGVNIGSNNPSYTVATDGVRFNGTTYDFELAAACAAGTYNVTNGYEPCTPAPAGSYVPGTGATSAIPWSVCGANEYILTPGTSTSDVECAPMIATTTTVTFGPGPFVANGGAHTATASVSPAAAGMATIVYTGDCVNAGSTCTATATFAGSTMYLGSAAAASITITPAYRVCAASGGHDDDESDDRGGSRAKGHESGSTIPVKIRVCDLNGRNVGSRSLPVRAVGLSPSGVLADAGRSNPGNLFRFDDGKYVFNMSTKSLAPGTYTLDFTIGDDPTVQHYIFNVRADEKHGKADGRDNDRDKDRDDRGNDRKGH